MKESVPPPRQEQLHLPRSPTRFPFHPLLSHKGAAWGGGLPRAPVGDQALQPGLGWVALAFSAPALHHRMAPTPSLLRLGLLALERSLKHPGGGRGLEGRGSQVAEVPGPLLQGPGPGEDLGGSLLCLSADWQQIGFPCRATHSSHHSATPLRSSFTSPVKARGTSNLSVRQSLYC